MKWFFAFILLFLINCAEQEKFYEFSSFLFGSYVKVKVLEANKTKAELAVQKALQEMTRLDSIFSLYIPTSEINQINQDRKGNLSEDLKNLLTKAIMVSEKTSGAFNITVLPLIQFWRKYFQTAELPDSSKVKQILRYVDYRKIAIRRDSIYLPDSFRLDLGGIAVGYCVDRAVAILKQEGIKTGLIDAGGDISGFGNRKWRVAVKNPRGEGIIKTFYIQNQAIATSGDYEKFFLIGNKRYHHILNPKTGYPAWGCCSVTVIAPDCVTADAYSTAIFVLGVKDGLAFAKKETGVEVFIVADESDNLKQYQSF